MAVACDPQSLVSAAACFDLLPVQIQVAILARLACAIRDGDTVACDPQALVTDAQCIIQCVPPGMNFSVLIPIFCAIANGGGGGSSCVLCDTVDPTIAPAGCTCALAYNTVNGSFWYWNAAGPAWVPLIQ